MKVLVLNGSPRGERSNTIKITNAFTEGLNAGERCQTKIITITEATIGHCLGCFACWHKTPGVCVIGDDMQEYIKHYIASDVVIWSFPLYYYGMPSKIKGFLDRLLPLALPEINVSGDGRNSHPPRYDLSHQRHVLISTCGFCNIQGNYDALFCQFDIIFGERLTKIICPQGELFRVPQLAQRTGEYLSDITKAGDEFARLGVISVETRNRLDELLIPADVYINNANARYK